MKLLLITPWNRKNIAVCQTVVTLFALLLGLPGRTLMISGKLRAPLWEASVTLPTCPAVSTHMVLTELPPWNHLFIKLYAHWFVCSLALQKGNPKPFPGLIRLVANSTFVTNTSEGTLSWGSFISKREKLEGLLLRSIIHFLHPGMPLFISVDFSTFLRSLGMIK